MSKSVFIIGGTGGIGEATVKLFAKNGYDVVFGFHSNKEKAEEITSSALLDGFFVNSVQFNVNDFKEVQQAVDNAEKLLGKIDVLVNAFGIAQQKLFTDITDSDWDNMINTNLKGIFNTTKAVLPLMIKRKSGKIINISSMWGITGASLEVHYSAAKSGVIGLTKALAKEVAPSNINVNCICPGLIDTKMNSNIDRDDLNGFVNSQVPLGRMGTPYDIAEAVLFLASENSSYITGCVLNVDGGVCI